MMPLVPMLVTGNLTSFLKISSFFILQLCTYVCSCTGNSRCVSYLVYCYAHIKTHSSELARRSSVRARLPYVTTAVSYLHARYL